MTATGAPVRAGVTDGPYSCPVAGVELGQVGVNTTAPGPMAASQQPPVPAHQPPAPAQQPLTPAQQKVLDGLMASGQPRPTFDADLPLRLLNLLEDALAPVAERLAAADLTIDVNKSALSRIHQCESHHVAVTETPFEWSPASARGTIAHRALQMSIFRTDGAAPLVLVDDVIATLQQSDDDWSPGSWLRTANPQEIAEVRADAAAAVVAFQECFPPLKTSWKPRMEFPVRAELCATRIRLRSKVDLALGAASGLEARSLLVDFKTGHAWPGHLDDLRYYALLDTLRVGVPPFRVATYYLDAGRWHDEDVTEDLLVASARRVVGGVTRMAELALGDRPPTTTPCSACGYCDRRHDCEGAVVWRNRDEHESGIFTTDPDGDPNDEDDD